MKRHLEKEIIRFNNEGLGIRSIARLTQSTASHVLRCLLRISEKIVLPKVLEYGASYEIDEMQTYVGKNIPSNYVWIAYAINRETRGVVGFVIGKRTKENLKIVTNKVLTLQPRSIYTDGLNIYKSLIGKDIHRVQVFKINRIERKNLTLRTHLKRLNRRTICFSRSIVMLRACLLIYFFS